MSETYDVAIVGYGPTGLVLASLLGQAGHHVVVFERYPTLYGLPRLTHIDAETARIITVSGDVDRALRDSSPIDSYHWVNGKERLLVDVGASSGSTMLFFDHISIYQPDIEDAIHECICTLPNVKVYQGWEIITLQEELESVTLTARQRTKDTAEERGDQDTASLQVTARYVIGADGANSFVRMALGISRTDFGFNERWLNVDTARKRPLGRELERTMQYCDPKRGHMFMPIGTKRERFEFALLPGEDTQAMERPEVAWKFLSQYHGLGPDDVEILRQVVYTFECQLATQWKRGRVLLAGDAAHTMPPYLGQGACSGMRDAANLAWKLDLVLTGRADSALLDSYEAERKPHVSAIMKGALALGKVANMRNPLAAFLRDQAFRFHLVPPPPPFPTLSTGVLSSGMNGSPSRAVGSIPLQGHIAHNGTLGRFDDLFGYRFVLLAQRNPSEVLGAAHIAFLKELGCAVLTLSPDSDETVMAIDDLDGVYTHYLDRLGTEAMLVRPDFVLFGMSMINDLPALITDLSKQLHWQTSDQPAATK
jgi:3-(3-hydroxy-phenyl)propionate hydroxylase